MISLWKVLTSKYCVCKHVALDKINGAGERSEAPLHLKYLPYQYTTNYSYPLPYPLKVFLDTPPPYSIPSLTMENPLKVARLNRGLTIDSLARQANVSKQLIIRSEQGTYVNPPPNLLTYLFPLSADQFTADLAYRDFQHVQRSNVAGTLISDPPVPPVGVHPFINWRTASGITTTMRFCILYCVQHAILHKFETKPSTVQAVPTNLREALLDAEISEDAVNLLELLFQNYKRQLRSKHVA